MSSESIRYDDRPRRQAEASRPSGKPPRTRIAGGATAAGGRVKKARWTAAEKRAAARR